MSFASRETSRSLAAPILLLLITYGTGANDYFAYTSGEDDVSYSGKTFTPLPIYPQDTTGSGTLDKTQLEIGVPKTAPIVTMFTPWPPPAVVTLQIYLGHVGETEFKMMWSGRILSVRTGIDKGTDSQDDATLLCEPISTSMRRNGLRTNYQLGCPHVLYGQGPGRCNADQASATVNVTVSAVENPYVELPAGWNGASDQSLFANGLATYTGSDGVAQVRLILRVTSSTEIQLGGDCSTLVAGATIALSRGCTHDMPGCNGHTDSNGGGPNIKNYGGQPWIPEKNPIGMVDNFL